jgi:hypothetical protein
MPIICARQLGLDYYIAMVIPFKKSQQVLGKYLFSIHVAATVTIWH